MQEIDKFQGALEWLFSKIERPIHIQAQIATQDKCRLPNRKQRTCASGSSFLFIDIRLSAWLPSQTQAALQSKFVDTVHKPPHTWTLMQDPAQYAHEF